MSEEQKKAEKEVIPNPDGYTFILCPLEKVSYLFIIPMIIPFCFVHSLSNEWMIPVMWFVGMIMFWVIAHKLAEAKVNIKLSDIGLEMRRLSGSKLVSEFRYLRWVDIEKFYSYGNRFRVVTREGTDFPISTPVFSLFEKQESNRNNYYAFENEFYKMAKKHEIEIRVGK